MGPFHPRDAALPQKTPEEAEKGRVYSDIHHTSILFFYRQPCYTYLLAGRLTQEFSQFAHFKQKA